MNRLALLFALAGTAFAGDKEPAGTIEWADSLEAARKQSARDGRPILLYFTFDT